MAFSDDADVSDIFIEPPDCGVLSDENSGDEVGGGLIENLPGSQLRAPAELKLSDSNIIRGYCEVQENEEMAPLSNVMPKVIMSGKNFECPNLQKIDGIGGDFLPNHRIFR
ncbi:hypothetical protein JTB14_021199 [Gonioctena quinquepunctata]|nr:hypothetical protein JTB14_021199 [Gonioctena quinquepunctata]